MLGVAPWSWTSIADAIGGVGLVDQHDGARAKVVEQRVGDLPVVRLHSGQAEPDIETLRVDDDMDLSREPVACSTETVICIPLFALAPAVGPNGGAVDHLNAAAVMASVSRPQTPAFRHRTKRL